MNNYSLFKWFEPFDADEISKLVKSCESQFRKSPEYSLWLNMNNREKCAATGQTRDIIKIELHHFRRTLYNWCEIIIDLLLDNNLLCSSHYICMILSDIHLNGCIPCLPLSTTKHQEIHSIGEDMFMEKYPDARDYLYEGDFVKADSIINEHINILKTISGKD